MEGEPSPRLLDEDPYTGSSVTSVSTRKHQGTQTHRKDLLDGKGHPQKDGQLNADHLLTTDILSGFAKPM